MLLEYGDAYAAAQKRVQDAGEAFDRAQDHLNALEALMVAVYALGTVDKAGVLHFDVASLSDQQKFDLDRIAKAVENSR